MAEGERNQCFIKFDEDTKIQGHQLEADYRKILNSRYLYERDTSQKKKKIQGTCRVTAVKNFI